ncbi:MULTISPECIES: hypothetical protein [unclassified Flavobacterium]|uniref:hypothetical protein n=1 Tax=unclassified Flavobacterium TaxID=196869 RepID=UPI000F0C079F|nr:MULTISPECIES: hypothetical protein [unclassified Flavobacterium]AYN03252.1 hypothetical protein EAG11_02995 [Flavobacterium sp. 140616W15]MCD0474834.1 hypothetical protein [Flavobacterium sp. EDS]
MKKIVSIALFAFLLNGCDDGNISVEKIDFENIQPSNCPDEKSTSSLIFKLKDTESLLLYVPKTVFAGEPTTDGDTLKYSIDTKLYRVIYRAYNGKVSTNNICDVIPPATPNVIEEWVATSGIIQVATIVKKDTDLDNNSSRIKGYTYSIVFKDITFNKPGGPQTEKKFPFGDFTTTIDALPLTFNPSNANQCSVTKQIYNFNDKASLTIDNIDPSLIVNKVTPPNEPRTGLINDITNKLFYRVFSGAPVDADYFCKTIPPANPSITQIWAGVNGKIDDDSGIIEVTTTTNANNFSHTITLRNTTLKKDKNDFKLGKSFVLGTIITKKD